ncbi:hypothetical protein PIB30_096497, partial [Stylosanthes scabra]|nr:hypothetical protein [Stylosanthes scabra]
TSSIPQILPHSKLHKRAEKSSRSTTSRNRGALILNPTSIELQKNEKLFFNRSSSYSHQLHKRKIPRSKIRKENYDTLSAEKKQLIDQIGLGAFAHLSDFYINHKLLIKLVRSYDVFSNTISTSVGEFMIMFEKVGFAFRLNCSGDLFEKRQVDFEPKLNDEEKAALNLFKGKTLTFVKDMEFKDKKRQAVKDCHFVLMIIYFKERHIGKNLNDPNALTLWIHHWSGEMLREKIRAEAEDVTIRKIVSYTIIG